MSINLNWGKPLLRSILVLVFGIIGLGASQVTEAKPLLPSCDALVNMAGNLYLVNSIGKVLTKFNTGGVTTDFVTLSPDGDKVAYAPGQTANTFTVVNKFGQQGSFPLTLSSNSYLMGLKWEAKDVLRITKFWGKDYAKFEFRHIPGDVSPPAITAAKSTVEQNCVLKESGGLVACIDQGGFVSLGGNSNGNGIYSVTGFEGEKPQASFNLHVGQSATPSNAPPYRVTVLSVSDNTILLSLDSPNPEYPAPAGYVKSGSYLGMTDYQNDEQYGYFATIINAKSGLVRIDIVKSNSPDEPFDMGLAWQHHGQGLLFVQHTDTQTFLDLIQPGRGHVSDHPDKGQGPRWHLAAQAPITLPGKVKFMRFMSPDLLLVNTGDFRGPQYSEVPIHIANGQDNGRPSMTVGTVKSMPAKVKVTTSDKTTQAPVLDWSCPSHS